MKSILIKTALAGVIAAGAVTTASAGKLYYSPYLPDGSQPFHSRAVAGAAPNAYATFGLGVRCSYRYRYVYGPYGKTRVRYEVCD